MAHRWECVATLFAVWVQATVLEVKEKLVALTNIPTDRQRLIFRGAVLQDTQGLATARKRHLLRLPPTAGPRH